MGPDSEHLKQVQRDAVSTTIRHFRDDIEDESTTFNLSTDLSKVREDLLTDIDTDTNETVRSKSAKAKNTAGQPDASGKSAGGAEPSKEAQAEAKPTNKTSNSRQ